VIITLLMALIGYVVSP